MIIQLNPEELVPSRPEVYSRIIDIYMESLQSDKYDPVTATKLGERYILCDGHNRTSGLYLLNKPVKVRLIENDWDIREYKRQLLESKKVERVIWETFLFNTANMESMKQELRDSICFLRNQDITEIKKLYVIRPRRKRNIRVEEIKNKLERGEIQLEAYLKMK